MTEQQTHRHWGHTPSHFAPTGKEDGVCSSPHIASWEYQQMLNRKTKKNILKTIKMWFLPLQRVHFLGELGCLPNTLVWKPTMDHDFHVSVWNNARMITRPRSLICPQFHVSQLSLSASAVTEAHSPRLYSFSKDGYESCLLSSSPCQHNSFVILTVGWVGFFGFFFDTTVLKQLSLKIFWDWCYSQSNHFREILSCGHNKANQFASFFPQEFLPTS